MVTAIKFCAKSILSIAIGMSIGMTSIASCLAKGLDQEAPAHGQVQFVDYYSTTKIVDGVPETTTYGANSEND